MQSFPRDRFGNTDAKPRLSSSTSAFIKASAQVLNSFQFAYTSKFAASGRSLRSTGVVLVLQSHRARTLPQVPALRRHPGGEAAGPAGTLLD